MQKSREGLLKSLMHQICQQCPVDLLCPSRWDSESEREWGKPWSTQELWKSILRLDRLTDLRLCLFIDGLDEYHPQDAHDELCDDVWKLAALPNVKLCISSRPWRAFQVGLRDSRSIKLESINRYDLMSYAMKRIKRLNAREGPQLNTIQIQHLVKNLVDRAEGVFLWLHLVVDSLCERLRTGAKYIELEKRLSELPSDLEEYLRIMIYQRMHSTWNRTKGPSLTALFSKLTIILKQKRGFRTRWFLYHIAERADSSSSVLSWSEKDFNVDRAMIVIENKVETSFGGLLILNKAHCVEYTHRTVHDFITSDEMLAELDKNIPQFISDEDLLCRLALAFCQLTPLSTDDLHLPNCLRICHSAILETPLAGQILLQELDSTLTRVNPSWTSRPFYEFRIASILIACGCYSFAKSVPIPSFTDVEHEDLYMLARVTLQRADFDIHGLRHEDIDMLGILFERGLDVRWLEPGRPGYEVNWNDWAISNATNTLVADFIHLMVSTGGSLERGTISRLESLVQPGHLRWLTQYVNEEIKSTSNALSRMPGPDSDMFEGECAFYAVISCIRSINDQQPAPDAGTLYDVLDQQLSSPSRQSIIMRRSVFQLCLVLLKFGGALGGYGGITTLLEWEGLDATHKMLLCKAHNKSHSFSYGVTSKRFASVLRRCMAFLNQNRAVTSAEVQRFLQEEVLERLSQRYD